MTAGAVAAREQGEEMYTHTLASRDEHVRDRNVELIEAEGWKLIHTRKNPDTPRTYWTLTFTRGGSSEQVPPPPPTSR
jgi:hypothetical protein